MNKDRRKRIAEALALIEEARDILSSDEVSVATALADSAAVYIDAYNKNASEDAKREVTINMVVRAAGSNDGSNIPIGATQGSVGAMGYTQSWTFGSGSTGELYLSKMDKKLLGVSNKIGSYSPLEGL